MRGHIRILAGLLVPLLLSPGPACATIYTWAPAAGGLTNTSVNWSPSGVPGANDDTRFWQSGVTYTITAASPADTFNTVSASSTGHPQFSCSDPLRVRNAFQVDGGTTASIIAGTAHAGWFTVGPGTLTISGNGTQAISTNSSAFNTFGNSSGFTSTVNVSGGATFTGNNIRVPVINGATGILNVTGHPTTGMASSLQAGTLDVGYQGVGDVELSAGANIYTGILSLGSYAYGKMHLFKGFGLVSPPTLSVNGQMAIGYNTVSGTPGGQGLLTVDQGTVNTVGSVIMGDDDGGSPDTLRMNGGSMTVGDRLLQNANDTSVLDLHGGSLFINDGTAEHGSALNQAVPLSVDGAGAGPTLTLYGTAHTLLKTTTPLSLIVGRSGGGNLNVTGLGGVSPYREFLDVVGNAVVADLTSGTGVMTSDQFGDIGIQGTLTVGPGNGLVQALHGSVVASGEMDVVGAGSTGGTVQARDSGSLLYLGSGLAIAGTLAAPTAGPATVRIDSLSEMDMQGSLVRIWGGGGKLAVTQGGIAFVDTALCSGEVQLANGKIFNFGNASFHLLNGGVLHGTGRVRTAIALDDTSARLEILASDPPNDTLTVGDSLRLNAFRSQGTVRVETGTLAILNKGVPDLGHVVLAGGTLLLPVGGHLRVGDVLEGNGRLEGNLTDDGNVSATGEIDIAGHLTVLAGDLSGNGANVLTTGELSARGSVTGFLTLGGQFDMGTALAKASLAQAPLLQPTNILTMRIGSAAHGAQDTLVIAEALTLAGALDLRTWKPDPSAPGDTLTLITAPSISGTFSKVTIDGVDAPSYIQVLYEPTRVRVAVLQSTTDVPPPAPGHTSPIALRFAEAGTMEQAALALDLPRAANVVLDVYNVAGRRMAELENGQLGPGRYRFPFDGSPGVYFAQARITDPTGRHALTARIVRLR